MGPQQKLPIDCPTNAADPMEAICALDNLNVTPAHIETKDNKAISIL